MDNNTNYGYSRYNQTYYSARNQSNPMSQITSAFPGSRFPQSPVPMPFINYKCNNR